MPTAPFNWVQIPGEKTSVMSLSLTCSFVSRWSAGAEPHRPVAGEREGRLVDERVLTRCAGGGVEADVTGHGAAGSQLPGAEQVVSAAGGGAAGHAGRVLQLPVDPAVDGHGGVAVVDDGHGAAHHRG